MRPETNGKGCPSGQPFFHVRRERRIQAITPMPASSKPRLLGSGTGLTTEKVAVSGECMA